MLFHQDACKQLLIRAAGYARQGATAAHHGTWSWPMGPRAVQCATNASVTPLEAELEHWVNCVNTRQEPTTGLESAKAVALVIDRVKELL